MYFLLNRQYLIFVIQKETLFFELFLTHYFWKLFHKMIWSFCKIKIFIELIHRLYPIAYETHLTIAIPFKIASTLRNNISISNTFCRWIVSWRRKKSRHDPNSQREWKWNKDNVRVEYEIALCPVSRLSVDYFKS